MKQSIKVHIIYDQELQKITKVEHEEASISEGMQFILFLKFIFDSHPEIPKQFLPGNIAISVNGDRPTEFQILSDGDNIELSVSYLVN